MTESHPIGTGERLKMLEDALTDALAFIRGDIAGSSQRDGILREGGAALSTGDSDLVERFARAMFDEWPLTAISPAIAERSGLPEGTVLTYDKVLEMGGNHDGLLRLAKGAAKLHTAIEATLSTQAAEIERKDAQLALAEAEARRFAAFYPEGSDGRNTLVMLADKIGQALSDTSGSAK